MNRVPPFVICALITYQTFYYSYPQDRTWHAVAPVIWTQVRLGLSIVTGCIPSIKRFFMDVQSGLMGVTISESYEFSHSGGKATQLQSMSGTTKGSRLASRFGISNSRSQGASGVGHSQQGDPGDAVTEVQFSNKTRVRGGNKEEQKPETESIKGLTQNVIHQRFDYEVEYEERVRILMDITLRDCLRHMLTVVPIAL